MFTPRLSAVATLPSRRKEGDTETTISKACALYVAGSSLENSVHDLLWGKGLPTCLDLRVVAAATKLRLICELRTAINLRQL